MMEWITGVLAVLGATLVLLAAIGLLRMPDLFHAYAGRNEGYDARARLPARMRGDSTRRFFIGGSRDQHWRVRHADVAGFNTRDRTCGVSHSRAVVEGNGGQ